MSALLAMLLAAAASGMPVPVLDHAVRKGDRLEAADFRMEPLAPAAARGALAIAVAAGMEAVRNLPAGAVVRSSDVIAHQLVRRGEPVAIRIVNGPLAITTTGRALGGGAMGDMIRVVTSSTNRTLDGQIDAAGQVRIINP